MIARFSRHTAVVVAVAIWTLHALIEMSIVEQFAIIPLVWAAHGLVLMLLMGAGLSPILRRASDSVRALACVAFAVVFSLLQTTADMFVTLKIGNSLMSSFHPPQGMEFNANNMAFKVGFQLNFKYYIWLFGFYAAFLALMAAGRDRWRALLAQQKAELDALRLQVNPHFLFNALNSLTSLIVQNQNAQADAMTLSLARYYRSVLEGDAGEMVSLDEEVDAIGAYLDIERVRLGDRLDLSVTVPSDLGEWRVPPLILQPIVENAVKHGIGPAGGGCVTLTARREGDRLRIDVENAVRDAGSPAVWGAGVGLANARNRLKVLFGDDGAVSTHVAEGRWRTLFT